MLFGPKGQGEGVAGLSGEFEEVGEHKPYLLNHIRPGVGLDDEAGYILAARDPNARFVIPTSNNRD
jgi:hypothetical protein